MRSSSKSCGKSTSTSLCRIREWRLATRWDVRDIPDVPNIAGKPLQHAFLSTGTSTATETDRKGPVYIRLGTHSRTNTIHPDTVDQDANQLFQALDSSSRR